MKVFFIHGYKGTPITPPWYPWLDEELRARGLQVIRPQFPNPARPLKDEWVACVAQHLPAHNFDDTIFIGHSLGGVAALCALQESSAQARAVFLIGAPADALGRPLETFFATPFDWATLQKKSRAYFCLYSKDDPYVPIEHGRLYAKNLGATWMEFSNRGHFEQTQLPELLAHITSFIA